MSEVLKLSYRGIGGFVLLTLIFTFAVTSLALLISGIAVIALSVYIQISPDILQTITVTLFTTRITDAVTASLLTFFSGILLILVGSVFLALTNFIWKYSLRLDKSLSKYVDLNVPKTSALLEKRKGDQIPVQPQDKLSKLERLASLKQQGILTESEFLQEKQLILKEKE